MNKNRIGCILTLVLLLSTMSINAQDKIGWDGKYKLKLSDFRSRATQVGGTEMYSLYSTTGVEFFYQMSNAEFMFTKNFNAKVNCVFNRGAACLIAPDTVLALDILNFAQYEFDLSELYARKLRRRIFEKKGAFSDAGFINPIYEEIQGELSERVSVSGKNTDLGRNKEKLRELHEEVLAEIALLSDFCKECKPPKKKK